MKAKWIRFRLKLHSITCFGWIGSTLYVNCDYCLDNWSLLRLLRVDWCNQFKLELCPSLARLDKCGTLWLASLRILSTWPSTSSSLLSSSFCHHKLRKDSEWVLCSHIVPRNTDIHTTLHHDEVVLLKAQSRLFSAIFIIFDGLAEFTDCWSLGAFLQFCPFVQHEVFEQAFGSDIVNPFHHTSGRSAFLFSATCLIIFPQTSFAVEHLLRPLLVWRCIDSRICSCFLQR